jgi:hypothetical protein
VSALQYYLYLGGRVLDITEVMVNCDSWKHLAEHCPEARCQESMTVKGGFLPVREECFWGHGHFTSEDDHAYASAQSGFTSGHSQGRERVRTRNNKGKGRRRR